MPLSDIPSSLLARCRNGDFDSFEVLFGRIKEDLYRIIYSFMRDHDDTDEVMQESLIRIFRYFRNLKDLDKFSSWAMRIVVNQCHTQRARKGRQAYTHIDDIVEQEDTNVLLQSGMGASPREMMMRQESIVAIYKAIDALPKRQRIAILLFEVEGLSTREVAEAMQCSEGAVKFNVHQARKKLQVSLSDELNHARRAREVVVQGHGNAGALEDQEASGREG